MAHQRLLPNLVSQNVAISALEKGVQWEAALRLLQQLAHSPLTPEVLSWNAAMNACEKASQ